MRRFLLVIALLLPMLIGCASGDILSGVLLEPSTISPNGDGVQDATVLRYTIGMPSNVWIWLEAADGTRYELRTQELRMPSDTPYQMLFSGTVPMADGGQQVLPDGEYQLFISAAGNNGATVEEQRTLTISGAATSVPELQELAVVPNPFSPNEDAIDDVVNFTYTLPTTATVSIYVENAEGMRFPINVSPEPREPGAERETWDGRTLEGALLPSGVYTYTITAADVAGNRIVERGQLTIAEAGRSDARITYARIEPGQIMRGQPISITVRVKNTGDVPIRTFGPPSGYRYTTNDTYASIEEHSWADRGGGYWRVGLGYEGNGAAYPFRWALSSKPVDQWAVPGKEDILLPGEEVEITGSVVVQQFENKMTFFVGLIHEGVGFPTTRVSMKVVEIGLQ